MKQIVEILFFKCLESTWADSIYLWGMILVLIYAIYAISEAIFI